MSGGKQKYTKEQMIEYLIDLQSRQEGRLRKSDVPEPERSYCHALFGKWIYALEAAGIIIPTERTIQRRKAHKEKWHKKHLAMRRFRDEARKQKRKERENDE